MLIEASGLNIDEIEKVRGGVERSTVLSDVIKGGTKVDTKKGKTKIAWISRDVKVAFEMGDFIAAFKDGKNYKPAFVTPKGIELKLSDILKTAMFGGGRGSGGGAENTAVTEAAQCLYCAGVWHVVGKMTLDEYLDDSLLSEAATYCEIDVDVNKIAKELTDDWIGSSILTANALRKKLGSGNWTFHRGSPFVANIEKIFKDHNKAEDPKPFANVNKWSPADIWCVKGDIGKLDLESHATLGDFNNHLKELYDKKLLVGVSLKKAKGSLKLEEFNTTGFFKKPIKYQGYESFKRGDPFSSKDMYITFGGLKMQLRSFSKAQSWQGEIKGSKAAGGKIGGGILEAILKKQTNISFPYGTGTSMGRIASRPTPEFLQELFELYLLFGGKDSDKREFIKKAGNKKLSDWRYSKFLSMFFVAQLENNKRNANKICDNIAGYSLSSSDLSAPFIKAQ